VPAISSKIPHVPGFRLATLASTRAHATVNTNLQKRVYTTIITGFTLTDQTQLRFRCDASGNSDYIYIDEVVISAQ